MKNFIWIILLSTSLYAQDPNLCIPQVEDILSNLADIHKHLEDHGANEAQIEKAACKNLGPPSPQELDAFISSKSIGSISETVNGIRFENESPVLIEAFRKFTTAKDLYGVLEKPENQKDFQKEFQINPSCTKVRCSLEKVWGKGVSEKILYLNLKHNYNASELAFDKSERFSEEEINDVLMGINDLPPHLIPTGFENQRLTHFKKGYTLSHYSSSTIANAVIMIFDPWDDYGHRKKQYAIFHEVSHNTASKLNDMDQSPDWLAQSSWIKTGDEWNSAPDACNASNYGATNPFEDFAESMSTYRYNPDEFKTRCPEKYSFIREKVFKGAEYTVVSKCEAIPKDQLSKAQALTMKSIMNSLTPIKFSSDAVKEVCSGTFSYPPKAAEREECSFKLMSSKELKGVDHISSALNELGIYDSEANQIFIRQGLQEEMSKDLKFKSAMISNSSGIDEAISSIIEQSISDVMPKDMGNKALDSDSWEWIAYQGNCLSTILGRTSQKDFIKCHLNTIVQEDKKYQSWNNGHFDAYKVPPIFKNEDKLLLEKKRDEALVEHLSDQKVTKEAMSKIIEKAKERMNRHQQLVSYDLVLMKKWKNESPEEFCAQTYAKSSSALTQFGAPADSLVPDIQKWCVSKQSEQKKRYEFTPEEWNSYVESLFK